MGRRASSSLNAPAIVGIVAVVVVLVTAGALVLRKGRSEGFPGPTLPVEETFSNANAMRRNEFAVQGTVYRIESRDTGVGVCLLVESEGEEKPVFIKIPEELATINIQRDVTYAFKVRVGEGGVNIATAIKRP